MTFHSVILSRPEIFPPGFHSQCFHLFLYCFTENLVKMPTYEMVLLYRQLLRVSLIENIKEKTRKLVMKIFLKNHKIFEAQC